MAEWLYEDGIGEARAALVEGGEIIAAQIEPHDGAPRVGAVVAVRLIERDGQRGVVRLIETAHEGLIDRIEGAITIGAQFNAEVVRQAIPEPGALKRMKLRAAPDRPTAAGPALRARIAAEGAGVRDLDRHGPDLLEAAGWSETLEAAATGHQRFAGGTLRIDLTAAMTLIDVDGPGTPAGLARAGAAAAAAAIRRFDITGSIGIDLPTVSGKAERAALDRIFDDCLPPPFERTAVNGFGFVQIVRPRLRPSLCERLRHDPIASAARALLRRAQRSGIIGGITLRAAPAIIAAIAAEPGWLDALSRQSGGPVALQADAALPMSTSDAVATH